MSWYTKQFHELTVDEYLFGPCSKSLLGELSQVNEYWETCESFYIDNTDQKIEFLTGKQKDWLIKIKNGLLEKAVSNW